MLQSDEPFLVVSLDSQSRGEKSQLDGALGRLKDEEDIIIASILLYTDAEGFLKHISLAIVLAVDERR